MTAQCIHVDETSLRVDKKNHWIHVYSSGDITIKFLHQKRGKEAIEFIGVIPLYGGIIIHDCWASYLSYGHLEHGLCGSHLLRELTFIIDFNVYRWAKKMKRLLQRVCKMVSRRKEKCLTANEHLKLQHLYKKILLAGKKELPPIPEKTTKRGGKVAKSDAHNLWERLDKYETSVLLFAKHSHVPFTNNRAADNRGEQLQINLIEELNPEWCDLYEDICCSLRSSGCRGQAAARRRWGAIVNTP